MFSIAPLLFIMISVAGLFFGVDAVRGVVFAQVADLMGENGAEAVQEMLAHVSEPKTGRWAAALSMVVLVFGATTVFGQLQSALDAIWEVSDQAKASGGGRCSANGSASPTPSISRSASACWSWCSPRSTS